MECICLPASCREMASLYCLTYLTSGKSDGKSTDERLPEPQEVKDDAFMLSMLSLTPSHIRHEVSSLKFQMQTYRVRVGERESSLFCVSEVKAVLCF